MAGSIHVGGFVTPGFEKVRDAFRANFESGLEEGASFAAYYRGALVVNLWGGHSDKDAGRLWKKDDVSCIWSSTKGLSAIVIAHLVDRGLLDYKEKVSTYWPEFSQHGKGDLTLEQYLSHRAGLPVYDQEKAIELLMEAPRLFGDYLASQKPLWEPGSGFGYHAVSFGLYLDQIVRRVDLKWRSLAEYFREEIAEPFGIDINIGLPKHLQYRAARTTNDAEAGMQLLQSMGGEEGADLLAKIFDFRLVQRINDPEFKEMANGSVSGFGTAEALAKIYGILANGGTHEGQQLLSTDTLAKIRVPLSWGKDEIFKDESSIFSTGFLLFGVTEDGKKPTYSFGHPGYGGQLGLADPDYKVGLAYTTCLCRTMDGLAIHPPRIMPLYNALMQCVREQEGHTGERTLHYFYRNLKEAGHPIAQL
ncbi:hypothetical protein ScPMuIL_003592 [Solemya velum]